MAELRREYEQCASHIIFKPDQQAHIRFIPAQNVVMTLKEKLTDLRAELIDSRSRVCKLEADCIKDRQFLERLAKQILTSSQLASSLVPFCMLRESNR